ncbi:hypothetical protein ILYODFUR_007481 [Ilyodon furcidens]|uniref:Agouti signaling protein n=1 Tax=Ilyodon furcidens TaxID=33524 RepID=A0ABV0V402_9TELE
MFQACSARRRPRGQPRTRWREYVFLMAWGHLALPPAELGISTLSAPPATRSRMNHELEDYSITIKIKLFIKFLSLYKLLNTNLHHSETNYVKQKSVKLKANSTTRSSENNENSDSLFKR